MKVSTSRHGMVPKGELFAMNIGRGEADAGHFSTRPRNSVIPADAPQEVTINDCWVRGKVYNSAMGEASSRARRKEFAML